MTEQERKPEPSLGGGIAALDVQALCELTIAICRAVDNEVGGAGYRGGIFPDNIVKHDDGSVTLGPAAGSGWQGQELQFVAPELYWNGECGPESDVYSLGLLLWFGLSGGHLPLENESPLAQLSRMNGRDLSAPQGCPPRLGEIVEKATRFRRTERFENPRALCLVLESCLDNKYFNAEEGASLFRKEESELTEAEKILLDIIGVGSTPTYPSAKPFAAPELDFSGSYSPADAVRQSLSAAEPEAETAAEPQPEDTPDGESVDPEEAARQILAENAPQPPREKPEEKREELKALVEEIFGEPEQPPVPAPPVPDEPEDVRVYEPAREKKAAEKQEERAEKKEGIPILTVEEHPELAPVVPQKRPLRYSRDETRSREIAAEVKKRRTRPVGVVLILCGLLIIAALIANHFLQDYEWEDEGRGRQVEMPQVGEDAIVKEGGFLSAEEYEQEQQELQGLTHQSYYQIFPGDISWTSAKNAATDKGGMLAVINSMDEFTMVTQLAQQSGMQGVWVGCHREGSYLIWETQEPTAMMTWADREPSYTDSRDGAAEDFIMLWNTGSGWVYIDCRNDPVAADPNIYSGRIGYVCEFVS